MSAKQNKVAFLSPKTCGIYKSGGVRFKTDPATGKRTEEIDNELIEAVTAYVAGVPSTCRFDVDEADVFKSGVIVPTYYDDRYNQPMRGTLCDLGTEGITLGELLDAKILTVRGGHGSPGNDQRAGTIPYIKVSDIRAMRMNINPTNLLTAKVAERYWRGKNSGLRPWDVLTPNRASSNIGEFAIVVPGEEQVVLTKEMFVFRVINTSVWDPFYLFWTLCLSAVRNQWRRIALMQTNREDCGSRFREIIVPLPKSQSWARSQSDAFRNYFETIAKAREEFSAKLSASGLSFIASAPAPGNDESEEEG
jgi:type I restriction enzyme M protein